MQRPTTGVQRIDTKNAETWHKPLARSPAPILAIIDRDHRGRLRGDQKAPVVASRGAGPDESREMVGALALFFKGLRINLVEWRLVGQQPLVA